MKEVLTEGLKDGKLTIALSGEIDAGNAEAFYEATMAAYSATPADIAFECAELDFIDSTTLGTFVKILKAVKTDGRTLAVKNLQPKIKKLFVICSLDTIMEIS